MRPLFQGKEDAPEVTGKKFARNVLKERGLSSRSGLRYG